MPSNPVSGAQVLPVFVVSLARAVERRTAIVQHLEGLGVKYRLVDAVDGRALDPAYVEKIVAPGTCLHPGAIGCYLSHLKIYETMVAEALPVALVLEDDARVSPKVRALLAEGCSGADFDYCFLDSDDHNDNGAVYFDADDTVVVGANFNAFRLSSGPQTTHAYLISQKGAAQRLTHAFPIRKPIDLYDHLPYEITFRYVVRPKLAWVSSQSLTSFTSAKSFDDTELRWISLRRHPMFYELRDLLKLRRVRLWMEKKRRIGDGSLLSGHRWKVLPSGREIVVD